jgi:hypothetical protein
VFELCALLVQTYEVTMIVGHEEISPGRKSDPGPAFPLDKLRDRLLGSGRNEDAPAVPTEAAMVPADAGSANVVFESVTMAVTGKPNTGGTGKPGSGGGTSKPTTGGSKKPGSGGTGKP